jgi:hypothetical protein
MATPTSKSLYEVFFRFRIPASGKVQHGLTKTLVIIVCGLLSESIREFFEDFASDPLSTPHSVQETVEKDHRRLEKRRCYAFSQLECLVKPEQWPNLCSFAVVESTREIREKVTTS